MKIISTRLGFHADHSSSSYDFVALEKRLTKEQQEEVRKLGVETNSYQGTVWSEAKREYLLRNYYDIYFIKQSKITRLFLKPRKEESIKSAFCVYQ